MGLAETLVAVAILGTSVAAFVIALSAGSLTVGEQGNEAVAQSLAQNQMAYTKNYAYSSNATTYPKLATPSSYSVSVNVVSVPGTGTDTDIQKITVTVLKDSVSLLTVSDYKVNR
jgi:type II secretory pathway pseudopilin PulG